MLRFLLSSARTGRACARLIQKVLNSIRPIVGAIGRALPAESPAGAARRRSRFPASRTNGGV
jgi:hypothetical protein